MSTTPDTATDIVTEAGQDNADVDVGIVEIIAFEMYFNTASYAPADANAVQDSTALKSNWRADRDLRKHWRTRAKQVLGSAAVAGITLNARRRTLMAACQELLVIPATPAYALGED